MRMTKYLTSNFKIFSPSEESKLFADLSRQQSWCPRCCQSHDNKQRGRRRPAAE